MIRPERRGEALYSLAVAGVVLTAFVLGAAVSLLSPSPSQAQQASDPQSAPDDLAVDSWALVDPGSGRYLAGENADKRGATAAVSAVMLALVALEETESPEQEVVVPAGAERFVGLTYSNVGLIAGERLSVSELLEAALISSGTDAAYTLAEYLGDGNPDLTTEKMNDKARELGLENTRFENPVGTDEPGNHSTARDLALISREAIQDPRLAEIVASQESTISTQTRDIDLFNTNELLYSYPAATGVKTGGSPEAGSSVAASAERGGRSYVAVVMGAGSASEASGAARAVLRHGFDTYDNRPLVRKREPLARLPLPYRTSEKVSLVSRSGVQALVAPDSEVERRVTTREAPGGAPTGETLGSVEVFVDGVKVGESPLVTEREYLRPSVWDKAQLAAARPFEGLWPALQRYADR